MFDDVSQVSEALFIFLHSFFFLFLILENFQVTFICVYWFFYLLTFLFSCFTFWFQNFCLVPLIFSLFLQIFSTRLNIVFTLSLVL
jgi:hypothetical protein